MEEVPSTKVKCSSDYCLLPSVYPHTFMWWEQRSHLHLVYTYNGMLFTAKEKEMLLFATKWMKPEDVILRELDLSQKGKSCLNQLTWGCEIVKFLEAQNRMMMVAREWKQEEMGNCCTSGIQFHLIWLSIRDLYSILPVQNNAILCPPQNCWENT